MERDNEHYLKLKQAIEKRCFVTDEAEAISSTSQQDMSWLFDFRTILFTADILDAYSELFWMRHKDTRFQVGGMEMTAIPLIAAIVLKFREHGQAVNGFVIRKSRKKSGLLKMVEGVVTDDPVILVDDIINSGGSIRQQLAVLHGLQKKVCEIHTILRFKDEGAYSDLTADGTTLSSIFDLNDFSSTLGVSNLTERTPKTPPQNPFTLPPLWEFHGSAPNFFYVVPKSGPVIAGDQIFFGTDDGTFFALNKSTGNVNWSHKIPFGTRGKCIFSTPATHNNLVYFGAYDGNLYALNQKTGKREWVFMEADWIGSSPSVSEDLGILFIGLEFGLLRKRGGIAGINAVSGKKIWEYRTEKLTHASPAYSRKFQVVACGSNDGILSSLDAKTGKLLWTFDTKGDIKYAPTFSDKHGVVVVLGHGETVYVLDTKTGKEVASYKMDFGGYSSPLVVDNTVICTSFDKCVHAFDITSGKPIWKFNTEARCFATPLFAEGHVYVGSNNGRVFVLDPQHGTVDGVFQTGERIVNKIAYDDDTGIFYVPTFANEVFALKKARA